MNRMIEIQELSGQSTIASTIMPDTVTAADLGMLLGLSPRIVFGLAQRGVITTRARNAYPLIESVARYCDFIRSRRSGDAVTEEKLRLTREQADKAALQNAKAGGELLDAADVRRAWTGIAADLRASFLAIPSRVASRLGLDRVAQTALEAEMRSVLETISARGSDDDIT